MAKDLRYKEIGSRHRAMARYFMIKNRTKDRGNPRNDSYKGIADELDMEAFIKWFMKRDFEGCSVDRKDSTKGYTMGNIRLISTTANLEKKRRTIK